MRFQPKNPHEVIRLYESGASIRELAELFCVSDMTMRRFLRQRGVDKRPHTISRTKSNKDAYKRPTHISGKELTEDWWESNNQAFCDAMEREYPGMKF